MTDQDRQFLLRKCESVLNLFNDGVPLKDVWDKDDTIRLILAYIELANLQELQSE